MLLCSTCRKLIYRTDACKGVGVECGRTDGGSKKSTAALMEVRDRKMGAKGAAAPEVEAIATPEISGHASPEPAGTQAPPVDDRPTSSSGSERRASTAEVAGSSPALATKPPRKGDRHRPGYMAEYLRNRRAAAREAKK